ncbi:oligosaccharide flippase family protein [Variovorax boronicumulans]|uniref:oligosaccharide flippase family protein n=1 Tax=Variovorax boronicumulans TaxID=436515 RepID=UPI0027D7C2A3|nr:oligosaccharide flippase family protein [Variovorax boronicumulans]
MAQRFLRPFVSTMGSRLATAALSYGLFWALSRMLGKPQLGGFSLLMNIFLMAQLLPLLGLSIPLMRRIATNSESAAVEVTNALFFAVPVSVALALFIGAWGHFSNQHELAPLFWLVGASLLPTAWTVVAEVALLGQDRLTDVARINFFEALLRTVLSVVSVRLGYGLEGVFVIFLSLRCVAALLYLRHPCLPLPRPEHWRWSLQKRNWREVPVFFSIAFVAALVSRLDVLTLSHLRGLDEVAIYAAASRLYDAAQMLPTVTALLILPTLSRQFISARAHLSVTLLMAVRLSLTFGLALALLACAFAQPVIDLLYRADMAGAAGVLRWLIFAAVIMVVDVILSSTMLAAKAQTQDLRSLAVGLFALALALATLVPRFGSIGTSAAVTFGLGVRVAVRLRWAVRELDMPSPWIHLARVAAACIAGLCTMTAMRPHGAVACASSGLLAYATVVVLSGGLGKNPLTGLRADIALLTKNGPEPERSPHAHSSS